MPMSVKRIHEKISELKKLIDSEENPVKKMELFSRLEGFIFQLPEKTPTQRVQKAEEYDYLGKELRKRLVESPKDANINKFLESAKKVIEMCEAGLKLIQDKHPLLAGEFNNLLACIKSDCGEKKQSIELFQRAIAFYNQLSYPSLKLTVTWRNLANSYYALKEYLKALESYQNAERSSKGSFKILIIFQQITAYIQLKNSDAVIVNFDRALKELEGLYSDSEELPLVTYLKNSTSDIWVLKAAMNAYFLALIQIKQNERVIGFGNKILDSLQPHLNNPTLVQYLVLISEHLGDAYEASELFSNAIKCYEQALAHLQFVPVEHSRCAKKRVKCILALGHQLYKQEDLPNALLQYQKVTSEVYFGENNLNNLFEALTMSIDILIRQNNRNDAMQDYERASSIGEQLGKDNDFYKRDTAILHYKMAEYIEDAASKLSKYLLIYNILENLCLDEETWPIFIDVTAKIGAINLKRKDYSDVADKLDMILHHIPTENKEQHVVVRKNLIYALLCLENFDDATEEINKLLTFLGDDQQELRICLLVYKVYCLLKMNQPAGIEFTLEAIDQLFVIDPLVIEAKILGYKILGDNYSSQEQYTAAVKCYQEAQFLLSKHKVDINIFNPKEITENLNTALKQTDVLAALQNLLSAEDVFDKHKEIIIVGLKVLEIHLQQSQVNLFYSVIELIDAALREKVPSIAYDFFETVWERLQKALIIGVKLTPEEYRKLTPEEYKQVKNVQRILIDKQSEYRGEYRDEHKQRGEPLITVPHALLNMTIKYIASHEQAVITKGVLDLGRAKTVEHIKKIVVETKSDGTNAATVMKEPIKKRFTPTSAGVIATISSVGATLLDVGFFSPKFADPELADLDACQPIRLFDALAAENARFENERKSMDIDKKIENINNTQRNMEDTQQRMKENLLKLEELIGKAKNKLSRKRKIEKFNGEDSKDDYNKFAKC